MEKKRLLLGSLCLAGAALSAYLLVWFGGWALLAALAGTAIQNMAPPTQPRAVNLGGLAAVGALMFSAGSCLTLGLLAASMLAYAGRPLPRWRRTRAVLLLSLLPIGLTVALALLVTVGSAAPKGYADLAGIWHPVNSDKHTYRFNPDGTVDSWWSDLPHGRMGTWSRSGNTVTVTYNRNWRFAGVVRQGSIKGTMTETSSGKPLGAEEWVRDGGP